MALSTNSGVISGLNSAEPLSSRNCSEAVDENANEAPAAAADEDDEDAKDKGRKGGGAGGVGEAGWTPTTPTTPKGPLVGCGDTSLNTSALTSPDEHRAPEPVLDVDMDRLRRSVPSLLSSFKVTQKIGEGTFSTVFKAHPLDPRLGDVTVALKHIIPASKPQRTENEVKCLKDLDGRDNVCPVLSCIRENDHIVLVMPHVPHDRFQDYMLDLRVDDVRDYMWNLLLSLRRVHSFDIIHRDVKPANFLFHRRKKTYCLVDFGLAHPVQLPPPPVIPNSKRKSSSSSASLSAAPDMAALRKSPRKTAKPENYSDSRRSGAGLASGACSSTAAPSPGVKRKLVDAEAAPESLRASPRKKQNLSNNFLSSTSAVADPDLSPGKRKRNQQLSMGKNESLTVDFNKKTSLVSSHPHSPSRLPPAPSDEFLNVGGGSRTFKSPRRVLLQKRLADQAESSAPPSLRPKTLLPLPSSPGQQQQQQQQQQRRKKLDHSSAAAGGVSVRGPLRASHHLPTRGGASSTVVGSPAAQKQTQVVNKCLCMGKATICSICSVRPNQNANRAGTPGFRSPEVLLKSQEQNTAVDIWSAGVIFLSVLSGRYPFFKVSSDQSALAQIIAIFGIERVEKTAFRLGKKLVCSERCPAVDLRQMCQRLRRSALIAKYGQRIGEERSREEEFPDSAYDLLRQMMDVDADTRITAAQALQHPFLKEISDVKLTADQGKTER